MTMYRIVTNGKGSYKIQRFCGTIGFLWWKQEEWMDSNHSIDNIYSSFADAQRLLELLEEDERERERKKTEKWIAVNIEQ